jgi:hypothetical protein
VSLNNRTPDLSSAKAVESVNQNPPKARQHKKADKCQPFYVGTP